jgi:hypothetical protein
MTRVTKLVAVSACVLCLAGCGEAKVHAAVPDADIRVDKLIAAPAPGELETTVWATKSTCDNGVPAPTQVTKEFTTLTSVAEVQAFYTTLLDEEKWFHRADSNGSNAVTLNYSRQEGDVYWQAHLVLPKATGGLYEVQLDAFNNAAFCSH